MTLTIAIIAYIVLSVLAAAWIGQAVDAHERASRPVGRRRVE